MIIVEGPDQVGKTTLCHRLVELLNESGYPHVYHHLSLLPRCFDKFHGYLPLMSPNIVMDRFHMSRQMYGTVYPAEQDLNTPYEIEHLDAHLELVCGFTVLVTATQDRLSDAWDDERDEMYKKDGVLRVNEEYLLQKEFFHVDEHLHLSEPDDWPSDQAEAIVKRYIQKREALDAIAARC